MIDRNDRGPTSVPRKGGDPQCRLLRQSPLDRRSTGLQRAAEVRGMTEHVFDPEAKEVMLTVAACYEKVAKRAPKCALSRKRYCEIAKRDG